jgi:hypothetical protein
MRNIKSLTVNGCKYHKRTHPDRRIIISKEILVIEYSNGTDLVIKIDDIRAKKILKLIALYKP